MPPPPTLTRELIASAAALRALARDLIGKQHADDLVQETMLRALRNPPAQTHGIRPWLTTILRNLARNYHRDAQRRRERELAAHERTGNVAADNDHESLRQVTEALWQLPEPYQSTLARRYFADMTPTQIAAATSTALATVKSRLRRGLMLLREELARRRGPRWRAALAGAVGLPLHSTTGTITATSGVLLMAHASKILFAVAAAAVATWLLIGWHDDAPPPDTAHGTSHASAASGQVARIDRETAPIEREQVADAGRVDTLDLSHPFDYELRCRIIDSDGLIVPAARVAIAPHGNAINRWHGAPDEQGVLTVTWQAKTATMKVWVGMVLLGNTQLLREVDVNSGLTDLAMLANMRNPHDTCAVARPASAKNCMQCHQAEANAARLFDARLPMQRRLHPESTFADLLLGDTGARMKMPTDTGEDGPDLLLRHPESPPAPNRTVLRGIVRDQHGEPAAGVTVMWGELPDLPMGRMRTSDDGTFEFSSVAPGAIELRAGGGANGLARLSVQVAQNQQSSHQLTLNPEQTLAGRLVLPRREVVGEGVDLDPRHWRVEYLSQGAIWSDGVRIGEDGTFHLANLPTHSGRLLLWSDGSQLPAAFESHAVTGTQITFDMSMRALPTGRIRVQVSQPDQPHKLHFEVFAFQVDTQRGTAIPRSDGVFELTGLPAGFYRVGLIGTATGHIDLGERWVDGKSLVDLGSVPLPAAGLLRVPDRQLGDGLELYQRRRELDANAAYVRPGQTEFLLPAGDWLMMWGKQDAPQVRSFTITSDEELALPIGK